MLRIKIIIQCFYYSFEFNLAKCVPHECVIFAPDDNFFRIANYHIHVQRRLVYVYFIRKRHPHLAGQMVREYICHSITYEFMFAAVIQRLKHRYWLLQSPINTLRLQNKYSLEKRHRTCTPEREEQST